MRWTYPGALSQAVETKLICNLGCVHSILQRSQYHSKTCIGSRLTRKILLVGEDQEQGIPELILVEHSLQFFTGFDNTVTIVAINNEDDALSILEVVSP